ncbi:MAG: DUF4252 domain-containing protein [bacterium]
MKHFILALGLFITPFLHAQTIEQQPGYVDFSQLIEMENKEAKVEINLGKLMLGFLAAASKEDDQELANTLSKLIGIRVLVYEKPAHYAADNNQQLLNNINGLISKLKQKGWQATVRVKEDDQTVNIFVLIVDEKIVGMTVLVAGDKDDNVFINIVGEIDPAQLGKVSAKLGVPVDL